VLATFVIGLREGLEAALIVGIVAAFLQRRGRTDALRTMWLGVGLAILLCIGVAVVLEVVSAELPAGGQEAIETVVAAIAVAMVTYMILWMRRHSRALKEHLEGAAASALHEGTTFALVGMAFLAVLREGFETAVFLLAAFQASSSPIAAGLGALLGIVAAVGIGFGIFRGGVSIDLGRFFRLTGLVLVLVAAGLVASALHTAHETGWLDIGQVTALDLSWLMTPDSLQSALLTGVLGIQPQPVQIEVIGWLAYAIPVGLYVAWPRGTTRTPAAPVAPVSAGPA
jgi:high-affinity iron transporter